MAAFGLKLPTLFPRRREARASPLPMRYFELAGRVVALRAEAAGAGLLGAPARAACCGRVSDARGCAPARSGHDSLCLFLLSRGLGSLVLRR